MSHATAVINLAAQHQTTRQRCRIAHLGLDTREVLVIESLFQMKPELATRFAFGEISAAEPADVVFVNGDSADALRQWDVLQQQNACVVPIMVTAGNGGFAGAQVLHRPLSFRHFEQILAAITATDDVQPVAGDSLDSAVLRILVVDDSFPARQFMKMKLEELAGEQLRVHVDFADSGEKALRCMHSQPYDLVFLDVIMPGMDGYEACALIKAVQPVRVAMLTSRSAPVDFTRGRASGCDNYLPKPPNDIDLRTVLRLTSLKKMTATSSNGRA